jgi:biopolymer transport protein ExbB/TolQ
MKNHIRDQKMLSEAYEQVQQGGYGSAQGAATQEDITRMGQFVRNVLSNYAYSKEIPEEFRADLQSWANAEVTAGNYDKVFALISNIRQQLPNTDIANMINQFTSGKSSQGTTTPFARG